MILPVVIPETSWPKLPKSYQVALTSLNEELKAYAEAHERVAFVDPRPELYSLSGAFIDNCCHLSPDAAEVQAQIIWRELSR